MEKWNELCFILSESIPSNASEQVFELKVIQAFEKLGWSHFKREISVRENIQLGASTPPKKKSTKKENIKKVNNTNKTKGLRVF